MSDFLNEIDGKFPHYLECAIYYFERSEIGPFSEHWLFGKQKNTRNPRQLTELKENHFIVFKSVE
jgi:hypothetical protein